MQDTPKPHIPHIPHIPKKPTETKRPSRAGKPTLPRVSYEVKQMRLTYASKIVTAYAGMSEVKFQNIFSGAEPPPAHVPEVTQEVLQVAITRVLKHPDATPYAKTNAEKLRQRVEKLPRSEGMSGLSNSPEFPESPNSQ